MTRHTLTRLIPNQSFYDDPLSPAGMGQGWGTDETTTTRAEELPAGGMTKTRWAIVGLIALAWTFGVFKFQTRGDRK